MASQTVEKTKHQEVSFGGAQVINTEKDEKNKQPKDVIGCILRGVIILSLICLFIPALNPARKHSSDIEVFSPLIQVA